MPPGTPGFTTSTGLSKASLTSLFSGRTCIAQRCPQTLPAERVTRRQRGRCTPTMDRVRRRPRLNAELPATLFEAPPMRLIDGTEMDFSTLKGKVVMVVNVASQDSAAGVQIAALNELYSRYHKVGFEIVAFPSNWFGQYEPGSDEDVALRLEEFGVKFIVMSKLANFDIEVNPLFELGRAEFPGEILWNFEGKFLFSKAGKPVARFDLLSTDEFIEGKLAELI